MKRPDCWSGLFRSWSGPVAVFFQSWDWTFKHYLEMWVFKFLSDLDFWLICFTSSSQSALFRIQGMFRDARRQVPQGSMGSAGDLECLYAPLLFRLYPSANCKAVVLVLMLIPGVRTCNYSWFWLLVDRISHSWYQSDPGYAVVYSKPCIAMVRP